MSTVCTGMPRTEELSHFGSVRHHNTHHQRVPVEVRQELRLRGAKVDISGKRKRNTRAHDAR